MLKGWAAGAVNFFNNFRKCYVLFFDFLLLLLLLSVLFSIGLRESSLLFEFSLEFKLSLGGDFNVSEYDIALIKVHWENTTTIL